MVTTVNQKAEVMKGFQKALAELKVAKANWLKGDDKPKDFQEEVAQYLLSRFGGVARSESAFRLYSEKKQAAFELGHAAFALGLISIDEIPR